MEGVREGGRGGQLGKRWRIGDQDHYSELGLTACEPRREGRGLVSCACSSPRSLVRAGTLNEARFISQLNYGVRNTVRGKTGQGCNATESCVCCSTLSAWPEPPDEMQKRGESG
ncbi:hypothetical protein LIA77_06590 [Sarocladium implicatum]|nr:hypothetical protein LIA77_06590 [Sarocladium implicatum]